MVQRRAVANLSAAMTSIEAAQGLVRKPVALDAPEDPVGSSLGSDLAPLESGKNSVGASAAATPTATPLSLDAARLGSGMSGSQSADDEDDAASSGADVQANGALPSKGSAFHASGQCVRCCFYVKGRCRSGLNCQFCHLQHEKRSRGRGCRGHGATKKNAMAVADEVAVAAVAVQVAGSHPIAAAGSVVRLPPPGLESVASVAGKASGARQPVLSTAPSGGNAPSAAVSRVFAAAEVDAVVNVAANRTAGPLFSTTPAAGGTSTRQTGAVVLSTAAPDRKLQEPVLEASSDLPRLLGATGRWRSPAETMNKEKHPLGDAPIKVLLPEALCSALKLDPSAPVKKRVPQWM